MSITARAALALSLVALGCGDDNDNDNPTRRDAAVRDSAPGDSPAADAAPDAFVQPFVINEIFVDRGLVGSQAEYVEIAAAAGTSLDDRAIRVIESDGSASGTFPLSSTAGTLVPGSGLWVIGGGLVTGVDEIVTNPAGWGLDTAGAIQLLDTSTTPPTLLDVIGYSTDDTTAVTAANGLTAPTTLVEGTHVVLPADGADTLARSAGFVDTGDNRADVCTQDQSPGAANADC